MENILICQDIIKLPRCLIKMELQKAYATVEWDDLLLFSKGDSYSMMTVLRPFATFSKAYGLNLSKGKSNAYFNGVPDSLKAEIMQVSGLVEGALPFRRSPLVSWDKVCKPKQEGGLGLMNDIIWNKAAVRKLVWWLATKPDHLWVRLVNHTYLRGQNWQSYSPNTASSWCWRKICQTKEIFSVAYQQQTWSTQNGQEYTVAKGYEWLREKGQKVQWCGYIWNKWSIPKHSFISWIYQHGNMNTNAKLCNLGIKEDNTCYICGSGVEDMDHLFFDCRYGREFIAIVGEWLRLDIPADGLLD
ncbi:uncharacterized protein LOC141618579 [Silene latifolia]|uniref:uncharacterized protein LOC141618579 n=1 Tax=Silene latifolia TaxID=37657 RepID=UPI003D7828EF